MAAGDERGGRMRSLAPARGVAPGTPAPGIAFRVTLEGWFALGARDPDEGVRIGRQRRTRLRLRALVRLPDLDRFLDDREHPGIVVGLVDLTLFGAAMPAEHGDLRLFAPAEAAHAAAPLPGARLVVLGLSFLHEERELHVATHALLRGGLRGLWRDATTLPATMHREGIGVGPAIGAGILRLDGRALATLVASLRAPGATDVRSALRTVVRFGRFVARELWAAARRRPDA